MNTDLWIGFLLVAVCSWTIGIVMGRASLVRSLTLCEDHNGVVGPHYLNEKFYYLVPESFCIEDQRLHFLAEEATNGPDAN